MVVLQNAMSKDSRTRSELPANDIHRSGSHNVPAYSQHPGTFQANHSMLWGDLAMSTIGICSHPWSFKPPANMTAFSACSPDTGLGNSISEYDYMTRAGPCGSPNSIRIPKSSPSLTQGGINIRLVCARCRSCFARTLICPDNILHTPWGGSDASKHQHDIMPECPRCDSSDRS